VRSQRPSRPPRRASGERARPPRVLVVAADAAFARAIADALSTECEVAVDTSPLDAIARIKQGARFDVIFADAVMPVMDGASLHRRIQWESAAQADNMVFMLGALVDPAVRPALVALGGTLIDKPAPTALLLQIARERAFGARPSGTGGQRA
jgi:CheY-like chemotaxis protein